MPPLTPQLDTLPAHGTWRVMPYRRARRSRHYAASSMDYQVLERAPQYQPTNHLLSERSKPVSELRRRKDGLRTLGRNEGCSSITELFRNFCTRQSLPWMAGENMSLNHVLMGITLTRIRNLRDFIAIEAVPSTTLVMFPIARYMNQPTMTRASVDKLSHTLSHPQRFTSKDWRTNLDDIEWL